MRNLVPLILLAALSLPPRASASAAPVPGPEPSVSGPTQSILSSSGSIGLGKAAADSFYLYGGPGTLEGKFETASGLPNPQGWLGVDLTDRTDYWQTSTFNADNLNDNGPGNHAIWAGRTAAQEPHWFAAPGAGNNWDEKLEWSQAVADPFQPTEVTLEFWYNHDSEPAYDFFLVEWDSAGTWNSLLIEDGTNRDGGTLDFEPPGEHFLQSWTVVPTAYSGDGGDEIRLRLRVTTDGAFSDQDGLWPTDGAFQADDIRISFDGSEVSFADFEPAGSDGGWAPSYRPIGDFSKVLMNLTDLDPCVDNLTPQWTFIDDGSSPNNAPGQTTGGSTSPLGGYGTPGGWVVNNTGGLRGDGSPLQNEIWSPAIQWNTPAGTNHRTILRFDRFEHSCCIQPAHKWKIRTSDDSALTWSEWRSINNFVFFAPNAPRYHRGQEELTPFIPAGTTHLQLSWAYVDPFRWSLQNAESTPAPFLDNVSVLKFEAGPRITALPTDLLQGGFPATIAIDASSQAARDDLDVPLDRGGTDPGNFDVPIVTVEPVDPNETLDPARIRLVWILEKNPLFEDAIRTFPAGTTPLALPSPRGWVQMAGATLSQSVPGVDDQYSFDLPDVDFFYPGDVLRYYVEAEAADGTTSTLPGDVSAFQSGIGYERLYVVRALPTLLDAAGTQPSILLVDYAARGSASPQVHDLSQIGLTEGLHYDSYEALAPTLSSGIGASNQHGAWLVQIENYQCLLITTGFRGLASPDAALLQSWHDAPGDRFAFHFGDRLVESPAPATYVQDYLGVDWANAGMYEAVGSHLAPEVAPQAPGFDTDFVANAGCGGENRWNLLTPRTGATLGHAFPIPGGGGAVFPDVAGSVLFDRMSGSDRKVDVTFPFSLSAVSDRPGAHPDGRSARARLLEDLLLELAGHAAGAPTTAPPLRADGFNLRATPNPFNPTTTISFDLGQRGPCLVDIFDIRGTRVTTLAQDTLDPGRHELTWNGTNEAGSPVASGVYFVTVQAGENRTSLKAVLVK